MNLYVKGFILALIIAGGVFIIVNFNSVTALTYLILVATKLPMPYALSILALLLIIIAVLFYWLIKTIMWVK